MEQFTISYSVHNHKNYFLINLISSETLLLEVLYSLVEEKKVMIFFVFFLNY